MPVRLVALDDGVDIPLDRAMVVVGRHPQCDARLDSLRISRHHCCMTLDHGSVLIRDLGSTNGIRINGHRVEFGTLQVGDELAIAHIRYRLTKVNAELETIANGSKRSSAYSGSSRLRIAPSSLDGKPQENGQSLDRSADHGNHHVPFTSGDLPVASAGLGIGIGAGGRLGNGSDDPQEELEASEPMPADLITNTSQNPQSSPLKERDRPMIPQENALAAAVRDLLPEGMAERCQIQVIVQMPEASGPEKLEACLPDSSH